TGIGGFLVVGVGGGLAFLVDAGLLQILVRGLGSDPYLARLGSFLCAVTATWVFNRRITFRGCVTGGSLGREWARYVVSQLGGFSMSYTNYAALIRTLKSVRQCPGIGVADGSLG